ncbi:MAG: CBS domain-containing protein [Acidobacteria bacterium]|nr:CBS domain-containing protein [Acidobacteriota bacterium]
MTVRDVLGSRSEVYSIPPEMTVHDAARYLRDYQIRSVAVVDARGDLAGVVSQSDISDKVAAENRCPAWMHVSEIMSTRLVVVTPDASVDECLRLMEEHSIYHLLVVDRLGDYRGMVSVRDLLRTMAFDEKARADLLEAFVFDRGTIGTRLGA